MDVDQNDYDFLKSAVLRAAADLRRTIKSVDVREGARGAYVIDHALAALDAVTAKVANFDELAEAAAKAAQPTSYDHLSGGMRLLGDQVRAVHAAVPWVEALRSRTLPLGLVYFVQEATLALGLDVDVLLHADPIYMYSTDVAPFGSWAPPPAEDPQPVIISFPAREAPSLFLNTIFVHELAHLAVDDGKLVDRVLASHPNILDPSDEQVQKAIEWYVAENLAPPTDGELPEQAQRVRDRLTEEAEFILRTLLDAWVEEILCDAIAFAYLGPSYLFACANFLYSASMEGSARAHPPVSLRMRIMFGSPDMPGWKKLIAPLAGTTTGWLAAISERTWEGDVFERFAGEFAIRAAQTIHSVAADRLGHNVFKPNSFASIQKELLELLKYAVLPAQLDHELAVAAPHIILAGWLHELRQSGDRPATVARALANRRLQAFLTKAIEMSALASHWEETGIDDASAP